MSVLIPQFEFVDGADSSIRYLEHGWPTDLCRWHSHEVLELHLIVDTYGKSFVGDFIGEFSPGALFLIGPNLPHNWVTDEFGEQVVIEKRDMLIQFSLRTMNQLRDIFPDFRDLDVLLQRSMEGIEFLGFDKQESQAYFESIRDSSGAEKIVNFLSFLVRLKDHPDQKRLSIANTDYRNVASSQPNIAKVVDHIIENFSDDISLAQAAEMSHLSATAFARNFQKLTGNRFTEFVTRVRVGQACLMLQASEEKIATICHEVGFKNLANFNRHFLNIKQITPSEYLNYIRSELKIKRTNEHE